MSKPSDHQPRLRRELTLLDSLMINLGVILGSAIFLVPASIGAQTPSPWIAALVWIVAGLMSLSGALTFAELSSLFPQAGGQFVYLEKAYSPFWGFLYGWTLFAVIQTASIAAVSVAFMTYLGYFMSLSPAGIKIGAILLILSLTAWNTLSLRLSANTQNVTTLLKLAMLGGIVAVCFLFGGDGREAFGRLAGSGGAGLGPAGYTTALIAALWAFDGWISITYVGGEVKNPQRTLPLSLTHSVLVLAVLYAAVQLAFSYALPRETLVQSSRVASDAVVATLGAWGGALVALAVIVSCFSSNNAMILSGARVYYAMSVQGVFLKPLARLNRRNLPANALWAQSVWACAISLTGSYDQLFTYVVVCSWFFYMMSAAGVIVLRRKAPHLHRPYRMPAYPWLPATFVLLAAALLVNALVTNPRDSLIGVGIMLAGTPFYRYWRRRGSKAPD